jgi:hypothetical protein
MKLLSVGLARALWFIDMNELNPGGKDVFIHMFPAILDDYKFKTSPKPGENFKDGMKFTSGEYIKDDGTVLQVSVTIYHDGIAADTYSSTKDSEDFLEEALSKLPPLGFAYDPEMIRRKWYLSQVNIKCSRPLHALNPRLVEFANRISSAVGIGYGMDAVEFWPDQRLASKQGNFSFQRKIGEPPGSDRYWSQAAVPTDKHIELLEEFEALLALQN